MACGEFDLIRQHLTGIGSARDDVRLDIGDDAAVVDPGPAMRLAVGWASAGVAPGGDAAAAAEHCAEDAVDALLARGGTPAWLTLALSVEHADPVQVSAIASGIGRACARHRLRLVGGDTTSGADAITVFACGPRR